ncbi:lamin tail domain-containing protein [Aerolutibacter ruishenii]|uniref:LTD domain-containing protein n=1 Tax=Aerolutibacter ruishenii TaxID=686800 RepID=A0A562M3D2_9GAMM|nr:lamin tail domain-containing protein [Lysobacter ruishenii]TWI14322.1 hypothetical protein IP93_00318 [Lysobacter ruishenii]
MHNQISRHAAVALSLAILACAGSAQAQVVISQIYGGGGNAGATYRNDFIELRNLGAAAVNLNGWSVQYTSSAGTTWSGRTNLTGSIAPGGYYLVQQAAGSGGTAALPTPDTTGGIAMSSASGKVALVRSTTALTGGCPLADANLEDFVGFGSSANCFKGAAPTGTLSNTTAALRKGDGATNSNDNAADFVVGAPDPRNSGSTPPPPPEPAVALSIAQIQGNGLASPHAGKRVVTEGVVTGIRFNNGFFLQGANDDGDATTSNAVFVFTRSAPPASVRVGHRVRVTGKVEEFTPSNPNQLSITEITSPEVELLASGMALPAAVALTAADLAPQARPDTLERLEGMRVSVAQAVVVGAADGSINERNATSTSNGIFHVTLPDVARPFREPGIGALDVIPIPAGKNPPRFDTNPERLRVNSRGQVNATLLAVDVGAKVGGLVGVLDYVSGTWTLLPDPASEAVPAPTVAGGRMPEAVNDADYDAVTVAGFNLLRFFDEVADNNGAATLTAAALDKRLAKTAGAICDYLKAPDILGVVEVENLRVLGLLAERINTGCARAPAYVPMLETGNDVGGINVGFLVSQRLVGGQPRVVVESLTQFGKGTTLSNPDGSSALLNDRPPLALRARVQQDNGARFDVTVINNHLRSLNDIDDTTPGSGGWSTGGARVRAKRGAQAAYLAGLVQSMQQEDPNRNIVLVGDFNAFEFNDGYVDVLGVIKGEAAAEDQVISYVASPVTAPLIDGSQLVADPAARYSYVYEGNAQSLDHVLVNEALLLGAGNLRVEHARINADFGVHHYGDASVPLRVSDHDPVRVAISVPSFRSADLSVSVAQAASSVHVGDDAVFNVTVGNAGPGAAEFAAIAFAVEGDAMPVVAPAAGWTCDAPVAQAGNTSVSCTTPALAVGGTAAFTVRVTAPDALGGKQLRLAVAVRSQITDPANADNQAEASVAVEALADLAVTIDDGNTYRVPKKLHYGHTVPFAVAVANAGPDAAWQPTLRLQGDAPAANVALEAPAGWTCTVDGDDVRFTAQCAFAGALAAADAARIIARVLVPARPDSTGFLHLQAEVGMSTPERRAIDNTAQYANRIVGVP